MTILLLQSGPGTAASPGPPTILTGLIGWWDVSVAASLTLAGSNITAIADQSGAGNNLVNSSGANRTVYNATGLNSRPAMMYSGPPGQFVNKTAFPIGTGNTLTIFLVATLEATSSAFARLITYPAPGFADTNSTQSWCITRNNAPQIQFYRNGTLVLGSTSYSTPYRIILTVSPGGVQTLYINGAAGTTATLAGNWGTGGTLTIGTDGTNHWSGAVSEVGIATGFSDATTVAQLDSYLQAKWFTVTPVNTAAPVISGATFVGATLTTTNGTWTGPPTGYAYQWLRGGVSISGATSSTYLLVTADLAATITVTVTASNAVGSASATSAGVGPIAASASSAFLARTSGLDSTHTNAYTALIDGLVADNVWQKLDLLHIYATQDSTTAKLNLVSTSYPAVANGSPTFTADRGFTGVGGSATVYINTGFNPSTAVSPNFVLNSAHIAAWNLTNASVSTNGCFGASTGTNSPQSYVIPLFSDGNTYVRVNVSIPSADNIANSDARGHYLGNRSAVSSMQVYRNGSSFGSSGNTSSAVPNINFYSLANNTNGTVQGVALQIAAIHCGGSLSSTDVTNLYNRLRTYMTAVGVP